MTTAVGPRVMVVTGACRGLGLEVARQYAARGDTVVLGARHLAGGDAAAAQLVAAGLLGRVLSRLLDGTDPAGLTDPGGALWSDLGAVDVLVNNAAVHYDTDQTVSDVDLAVVREALETNLLGAW